MGATVASTTFLIILIGVLIYLFAFQKELLGTNINENFKFQFKFFYHA